MHPDDEESSLRVKSSYADGIRELELTNRPSIGRAATSHRVCWFSGPIVDEAHRLVQVRIRLSQPLREKLADRGMERTTGGGTIESGDVA
jgi:hypothetical protein